ncbi:MAG TPA: hypothetical protein VGE54_08610 [Brevundimonas sp.]
MSDLQAGLSSATLATLESLRGAEWFSNVGCQDTDSADVLTTWDQAIESCGSLEWENLCLEAANQYRERLAAASPARFARWNDIVALVKPASEALVRDRTAELVAREVLPKVVLDAVNWDILHLCMEAEFSDVQQPGFYASQAYWYAAGHFPCGWRGAFPDGRLIIF